MGGVLAPVLIREVLTSSMHTNAGERLEFGGARDGVLWEPS